jgi:hypothetical protein
MKCTIAVEGTAIATGKKITKTGSKIVLKPKPVKRVNPPAKKESSASIKYSVIT